MSPLITANYALSMSAGIDAGNRSMRRAGRTTWNDDDWNAACAIQTRVAEIISGPIARPTQGETRQ